MVLMKPGCWHDTVWADRSWPEDQWLEYGTAVTGGDSYHYYYGKKKPNQQLRLFTMVKELLEAL